MTHHWTALYPSFLMVPWWAYQSKYSLSTTSRCQNLVSIAVSFRFLSSAAATPQHHRLPPRRYNHMITLLISQLCYWYCLVAEPLRSYIGPLCCMCPRRYFFLKYHKLFLHTKSEVDSYQNVAHNTIIMRFSTFYCGWWS